MAERAKAGEYFQQIGFTALRDPATGDFLPSVPLYIKVTPQEVNKKTGLTHAEEDALREVGNIFADKMKQYLDGGGMIKRQGRRKTT